MKFVILLILLAGAFTFEVLVTQHMTDYLRHSADWEVEDYETNVFRGWTAQEFEQLLGLKDHEIEHAAPVNLNIPLASSIDWSGTSCDHGAKNQASCGSCWAFAIVGMMSFRCCAAGIDKGWLSPQELVSCDKSNYGCQGGYLDTPMRYIQSHKGLVSETCFPYKAQDVPCPAKCADGNDWSKSHVCNCESYMSCPGIDGMRKCLASGPATFGFTVRTSFSYYKNGIYKCDDTAVRGGHAVLAMGHSDNPECHYIVKNSWGPDWGDHGYFKIGCDTCDIRGGVACTKFEKN